jgi:hypothetical protein
MDEFLTPPERVRAEASLQAEPALRADSSPHAEAAARSGQASLARIGLLGIAAAALVAVAILAVGWASAPSGLLAAGTTTDTGRPRVLNDLNGSPGGPAGPGGPGFGHGMGGIEIAAISGNSISLATEDGWTRTITVDDGTTYSKAGAPIALADLKVGDQIGFRQTKESDGSFTIDSIAVILPRLGGEVTAVDGSTITLKQRDGTTATIKANGDTTYTVNGNGASLDDVKVGMVLIAEGTLNDDGSLVATNVHAGDKGDLGGRGPGHGMRGGFGPFGPGPFGPGPDDPNAPDASAAPSASTTAS